MMMPGTAIEGGGGSRDSSEFEFISKGNAVSGVLDETMPTPTLSTPSPAHLQPHTVNFQSNPIMETKPLSSSNLLYARSSPSALTSLTTPSALSNPTAPNSAPRYDPGSNPATPRSEPGANPPPGKIQKGETGSGNLPLSASQQSLKNEAIVAIAEQPSAPGMFGWVRGGGLLSRVVEKTISVTENVITTLDPQMRDFIHSGGDVQIVVASDKDEKVGAIREAFQNVFGHATIVGLPSRSTTIAEQPVGFASGKQAALERISSLRKCGSVQKDTVVVSVENFLYEASENLWLDFSCLVLSDPLRKIQLQSYSQPTNVTPEQIQILKDSTPSDYPKQWSGFAVPIDVVCTERLRKHKFDQLQGGVMAKELQVSPELWQEAVSGISRRRLLTLAGEGLAGMYKREIKFKVEVI